MKPMKPMKSKRRASPGLARTQRIEHGAGIREKRYSDLAVIRLQPDGYTLFRNNVGLFRALDSERRVRCGLTKGSSDQIGWHSVEITPEHVGQRLAVFVALEVKAPDGRVRPEQENFLDRVEAAGGEAFLVVGDEILTWGEVK